MKLGLQKFSENNLPRLSSLRWILCGFLILMFACSEEPIENTDAIDQSKLDQVKNFKGNQKDFRPATAGTDDEQEIEDTSKLIRIYARPSKIEVTEGMSESFSVIGVQLDGQERSIDNDLNVIMTNQDLGEVKTYPDSPKIDFLAKTPGKERIRIQHLGTSAEFTITVLPKEISSIEINPQIVALGVPTSFELSVKYNNLTSETINEGIIWGSNDTSYLTVEDNDKGLFLGRRVGSTGIKATYNDLPIVSGISIVMPRLQSIDLDVPSENLLVGMNMNIKAIATFANGTKFDISSSVEWQLIDSRLENANFEEQDSKAIAAYFDRLDLSEEELESLKATGFLNSPFATLSEDGLLDAFNPGEIKITASYEDKSAISRLGTDDTFIQGSSKVLVTAIDYPDYVLEPSEISLPIGLEKQFTFYGIDEDGEKHEITELSRWSSSNDNFALSGGDGEIPIRGLIKGMVKVDDQIIFTAKYGENIREAKITLVDAAMVSMEIAPVEEGIAEGVCGVDQHLFTAEGTFSDLLKNDVTQDIVWSVEPAEHGSMILTDNGAYLESVLEGDVTIVATFEEAKTGETIRAEIPYKVLEGINIGVGITTSTPSIGIGATAKFTAEEIMSCGEGKDFTELVEWSIESGTSENLTATIVSENPTDTRPLGYFETSGDIVTATNVIIKAEKDEFSETFSIEVRPKEIDSIKIKFESLAQKEIVVNSSDFANFTIEATYSNGDTLDFDHTSVPAAHTLSYSISNDCDSNDCIAINGTTGNTTPLVTEGRVQVEAKLITPKGPLFSKTFVSSVSKCEGGTRAGLYCVYQSAEGDSCTQACTAIGGTVHDSTINVFGSAGDSDDCADALNELGYIQGAERTNVTQSLTNGGPGCSITKIDAFNPVTYNTRHVTSPATTNDAFDPNGKVSRVCACIEP